MLATACASRAHAGRHCVSIKQIIKLSVLFTGHPGSRVPSPHSIQLHSMRILCDQCHRFCRPFALPSAADLVCFIYLCLSASIASPFFPSSAFHYTFDSAYTQTHIMRLHYFLCLLCLHKRSLPSPVPDY